MSSSLVCVRGIFEKTKKNNYNKPKQNQNKKNWDHINDAVQ